MDFMTKRMIPVIALVLAGAILISTKDFGLMNWLLNFALIKEFSLLSLTFNITLGFLLGGYVFYIAYKLYKGGVV